jgi:phospholipid/cholesterol/gamma-HCH transport system substrate-binding protein
MRGLTAPLIKLGVFAVVTVSSTALLGLTIANVDLRPSEEYSAKFVDATSLSVGDDVRIAGVRIGQVESIDLVDLRVARVGFSVDARRKLPVSVTATIKYRNVIGQRYISLEHGVGPVNAVLQPGSEIQLDHTKPALDLTVLFNGFKPLFQALNPDDVNKLSQEIVQVLQGEGGTVESLLAHTASLTSALADKDKLIGDVIDNLNNVLDTVNAHSDQLRDLIISLQQFVTGFAKDRQPIGEAISSLDELAGATAGLLQDSREPLKQSIAALGQVSQNLAGDDKNAKLVDDALRSLPGKMQDIGRTISYGSWLNTFLCSADVAPGVPMPIAGGIPVTQPRCK